MEAQTEQQEHPHESSRAAESPSPSLYYWGSGVYEEDKQQTQLSFCFGGEALSRAMEPFSEPDLSKTAPPRAGVNFDNPYRVPWLVQNSCSRDWWR